MTIYESLRMDSAVDPATWLVRGISGFVGSNVLETMLKLNQRVGARDNFSTGEKLNLDEVSASPGSEEWDTFRFLRGDSWSIIERCQVCSGVDCVLHQTALGSVKRSIADPLDTNACNADGFLKLLVAARDANIERFVEGTSSSIYGDLTDLPNVENRIGMPLPPYAATKYIDELYANAFSRPYGFKTIGLRNFGVFGRIEVPAGDNAAVIPKWDATMLAGAVAYINGDGETSRNLCYVCDAVRANLLVAMIENESAMSQVCSIAVGIGSNSKVALWFDSGSPAGRNRPRFRSEAIPGLSRWRRRLFHRRCCQSKRIARIQSRLSNTYQAQGRVGVVCCPRRRCTRKEREMNVTSIVCGLSTLPV